MEDISVAAILGWGLGLSLFATALILGSFAVNPRLWINDFPREVRALVPPLTPAERRTRAVVGVVFLAGALAILAAAAWQARPPGGTAPFVAAFATAYGAFAVFNAWDLVVLDWLVVRVIHPRFMDMPGAEGIALQHYSFARHWRAFLRGFVVGAVASLPAAALASLWPA